MTAGLGYCAVPTVCHSVRARIHLLQLWYVELKAYVMFKDYFQIHSSVCDLNNVLVLSCVNTFLLQEQWMNFHFIVLMKAKGFFGLIIYLRRWNLWFSSTFCWFRAGCGFCFTSTGSFKLKALYFLFILQLQNLFSKIYKSMKRTMKLLTGWISLPV